MTSNHVVVDGSNIATEGRAAPSLQQLDEAVRALLAEYGYEHVTVVVDATFGHRIDAKEVRAYEEAVLNGELVTPPAGAIGRGDVFVLQIADRAGADVFSNDSFQEFHGDYPVALRRGTLDRREARRQCRLGLRAARARYAARPAGDRCVMPARRRRRKSTPLTPLKAPPGKATQAAKATHAAKKVAPPPRLRRPRRRTRLRPPKRPRRLPCGRATLGRAEPAPPRTRRRRSEGRREPINDQLVYLSFVVDHPLGTVVEGTVDRFSSHGAYVHAGDAQCYVPFRELGDPPPRSAREVLNLGETRSFRRASLRSRSSRDRCVARDRKRRRVRKRQ